jgi:hypothetical protein
MTEPRVAYLAQGRIHVRDAGGETRILSSQFAESLRDRAAQIYNRNAWKTQGFGAQFMQGGRGMRMPSDSTLASLRWTSLARGCAPGEVLYAMSTSEISGVFAQDAEGVERRLFHTADFQVGDVAAHPEGTSIAFAVSHGGWESNIAVMNRDGSEMREVSEGDSCDTAPCWEHGPRQRLLFQSAGLGRDDSGATAQRGPYGIRRLDLESGDLTTIAEDPEADLLGPRAAADGAIYFVRRPYKAAGGRSHPLDALVATVQLPFLLLFHILRFLSRVAVNYSRKQSGLTPLEGSGAGRESFTAWGEAVVVERAKLRHAAVSNDTRPLVPRSWQLIRLMDGVREVVAENVLAFDLGTDGSVIYSNGTLVEKAAAGSPDRERVLSSRGIAQIAAL